MNNGEYLERMTKLAKWYRLGCEKSINRNKHMNELNGNCVVDQIVVDAILTDFINFAATRMCIDYGLYAKDLNGV